MSEPSSDIDSRNGSNKRTSRGSTGDSPVDAPAESTESAFLAKRPRRSGAEASDLEEGVERRIASPQGVGAEEQLGQDEAELIGLDEPALASAPALFASMAAPSVALSTGSAADAVPFVDRRDRKAVTHYLAAPDGSTLDLDTSTPIAVEALSARSRAGAEHAATVEASVIGPSLSATEAAASLRMPSRPAHTFPFALDPFQSRSTAVLEAQHHLLVAAHTSAGKTVRFWPYCLLPPAALVLLALTRCPCSHALATRLTLSAPRSQAVAEYAIAMALHSKRRVFYTSPIKALSNQKYHELKEAFPGTDVGLVRQLGTALSLLCCSLPLDLVRMYARSESLACHPHVVLSRHSHIFARPPERR